MLMMTWQPYSFESAVRSSPNRAYLRQKYVRRIKGVRRIVLLCYGFPGAQRHNRSMRDIIIHCLELVCCAASLSILLSAAGSHGTGVIPAPLVHPGVPCNSSPWCLSRIASCFTGPLPQSFYTAEHFPHFGQQDASRLSIMVSYVKHDGPKRCTQFLCIQKSRVHSSIKQLFQAANAQQILLRITNTMTGVSRCSLPTQSTQLRMGDQWSGVRRAHYPLWHCLY